MFLEPPPLLRDLTWGQLFIPFAGDGRWLTPLGVVAMVAFVLFVVRCCTAQRPLVDLRGWVRIAREADLVGALLLAAGARRRDPRLRHRRPRGRRSSPTRGSGTCSAPPSPPSRSCAHLRRAEAPLVPHGALRRTPAWGALLVSFFVGAALIAALIDIPIFARTTVYRESQLMAALVLVRFLVALPVGALVGGYLIRTRCRPGVVTAVGMACSAVGFVLMAQLGPDDSLEAPVVQRRRWWSAASASASPWRRSTPPLLASTDDDVHGVATALVVVARMVGMLVGISALTTIGLRRYYAEQDDLQPAREVCGGQEPVLGVPPTCSKVAGIAQEQTVFLGRGGAARVIAGVLALVLVPRRSPTRSIDAADTAPLRGLTRSSWTRPATGCPWRDFDDLLAANRSSPPTSTSAGSTASRMPASPS